MPEAPDIPPYDALKSIVRFAPCSLDEYELVLIDGLGAPGLYAEHVTLRECVVRSVDLTLTQFNYWDIADVRFATCDFANAEWKDLLGARIHWVDSRLTGFKANECEIADAKFENCKMDFCQFRFGKLKGAWFENCSLHSADFSGADLTAATFSSCDLTGVAFSEAKCNLLDIRSSTIDGLTIGPTDAIGLIINPIQAADLIKVFGVSVLQHHDSL